MKYDTQIMRRLERYRIFFEDTEPGRLMVQAGYPLDLQVSQQSRQIDLGELDFNNDSSIREYLKISADEIIEGAKFPRNIDDDSFPYTWLKFGQAHCHLWLTDAPTEFKGDTSWTNPVLDTLEKMDNIKFDKNRKWYKIVLESYKYLQELSEGKFLIMDLPYGPMDLAQTLRGPGIYTDFYDSPQLVKKFLLRCADLLRSFQEAVWDYAGLRNQGEVLWGTWIPAPAMGLSVDGSCLCSVEIFEEFEMPAILHQFNGYKNRIIHTHMLGKHLLPSLVSLDNIKMVDPGTDPNTPRCMDIIDELVELSRKTGCAFYLNAVNGGVRLADIYKKINELKKGRFIFSCSCRDKKEAKELVKFVRANSKPF